MNIIASSPLSRAGISRVVDELLQDVDGALAERLLNGEDYFLAIAIADGERVCAIVDEEGARICGVDFDLTHAGDLAYPGRMDDLNRAYRGA